MKFEENETYYYDEKAAERAVRWIELYVKHYEESLEGQPFRLMEWQKDIVRKLFGWKRRSDKRRRFRELFLEIAKGNGKSPFITALALYAFYYEKRAAKKIFSIASNYKQAKITMDCAKGFIGASPALNGEDFQETKYELRYKDAVWEVVSGMPKGKSGFRPFVTLADEIHEWEDRALYDFVKKNAAKVPNSLMLMATNSGSRRDGICWELHERALKVLRGESKDETLLPVIYAADMGCDMDDEAQIRKANPSIGISLSMEDLKREAILAKESPPQAAVFRRLNLSQWIQGSDKWLDMGLYDACVGTPDADLKPLPLVIGIDLSKGDDLSSIAGIWVGDKKRYAKVWTYIPRKTAEKYEERDGTQFHAWATGDKPCVRYLESDTVDYAAHMRMKRFILKLKKKYTLLTVAYDRAYGSKLIAELETHGVVCVPVGQKHYDISEPTEEFARLLKAKEIVLPDNPCLRWQAENVEVEPDKYGNIRPIKEHAKGSYAGRRGAKIDGIVSIIIALKEVLRHYKGGGDDNVLSQWDGCIVRV